MFSEGRENICGSVSSGLSMSVQAEGVFVLSQQSPDRNAFEFCFWSGAWERQPGGSAL